MDSLINDSMIGKLSLIIGIIGIIIGYFLYRKGQKLRKPCWDIRTSNLINNFSSKLSKLDIKYQDNEIKNLSVSKIVFWNDGKEVIDSSDISKLNYLKIVPTNENVNILDCNMINRNSEASQIDIKYNAESNEVQIVFDYLNPKCGAVMEIIHTGLNSIDLKIEGDIKGVDKICNKKIGKVPESNFVSLFYTKKMNNSIKRILYTIYSLALIGLIFWVLSQELAQSRSAVLWGQIVQLLLFASMPIVSLIFTWKTLTPRGLENFEQEI